MSEKEDQFRDIAVWNEDSLGIIVLKSTEDGEVRRSVFSELILALGMASSDENIGAIVLAGLNRNFVSRIEMCSDLTCLLHTTDSLSALLSMVYSSSKPIYTILTGDAVDIGYEVALLGDCVISAEDLRVGVSKNYLFRLGGSVSSLRFSDIALSEPVAGKNVDKIFPRKDLLGDAKKFILDDYWASRPLLRRRKLSDSRIAILEEHRALIEDYSRSKKATAISR